MIDNRPPPVFQHLVHRAKKEQLMEERYAQIENDNRILLKKMSHIMRNKGLNTINSGKGHRTLNAVARKRELTKIMSENQAILKRIQNRRPNYNRDDWEKHNINHHRYLYNLKEKTVVPPRSMIRGESAPLPIEYNKNVKASTSRLPELKPKKPKGKKPKASTTRGGGAKRGNIGPPPLPAEAEAVEFFSGAKTLGEESCIVTVHEVSSWGDSAELGVLIRAFNTNTEKHSEIFVTHASEGIEGRVAEDQRATMADNLLNHLKLEGETLSL